MKFLALPAETREFLGFTHKAIVKFGDLTTAGATQVINLSPLLAANRAVTKSAIRLVTPFKGGALTAMTVDIGDIGSVSRFIAAATTDVWTAVATNTKNNVVSSTAYAYCGADGAANSQVTVRFNGTTDNVNAATAGELEVYLRIEDWSDLTRPQ